MPTTQPLKDSYTVDEYKLLSAQGKIHTYKTKSTKARDKTLADLDLTLKLAGIAFEKEFKFHPVRRFRFDRAIPKHMIAIEWEGIFSRKSGHTTALGYTSNTEKYNLAHSMGWTVLRYTALNKHQMIDDVRNLLKKNI